MTSIPERFIWAVGSMDIKPGDKILEIGCGAGLLAALACDRIETGSFLAIDRSVPMIEKARKRNQKHIERKISDFIHGDFSKSKLPSSHFDKVVAFNVSFFWKAPANELKIIKRILKEDGKLYVFHQAPFEIDLAAAEPIRENLLENGFEITGTKLKKLAPTSAVGVIAKVKAGM